MTSYREYGIRCQKQPQGQASGLALLSKFPSSSGRGICRVSGAPPAW